MKRNLLKEILLSFALLLCFLPIYAQDENIVVQITEGQENATLRTQMENNVASLFTTFKLAVVDGRSLNFGDGVTKEARKMIQEMWKSSAIVCPSAELKLRCLTTPTGFEVRNIPVTLIAAEGEEQNQHLAIDFTKEGAIEAIMIAMDEAKYEEIISENESVLDMARRQIILKFVENFRTAYCRKDLSMLQRVYSDKALIITGRVVKIKDDNSGDQLMRTLGQSKIAYVRQTKQQYLTNLAAVFRKVHYLNVKFEDIEVVQHPKYPEIYGVTLKQDWHSDSYQDEGYLFLVIDFKDELNPLIQVRTWQPYRFQGKVLSRDDVFHLGSFDIVR